MLNTGVGRRVAPLRFGSGVILDRPFLDTLAFPPDELSPDSSERFDSPRHVFPKSFPKNLRRKTLSENARTFYDL